MSGTEQPMPSKNSFSQPVYPQLIKYLKQYQLDDVRIVEELRQRRELGIEKYGTELHTFNGRDCLRDCKEELLDLAQYVCQLYLESDQDKERTWALHNILKSIHDLYFDVVDLKG